MKYLPLTLSAIALVGCSATYANIPQAKLLNCEFITRDGNYINCYTESKYYATVCEDAGKMEGREGINAYYCKSNRNHYVFTEPSKQAFKPVTWDTCVQIWEATVDSALKNGVTIAFNYDDMHSICDRYSK
jgi:hypothetical protein